MTVPMCVVMLAYSVHTILYVFHNFKVYVHCSVSTFIHNFFGIFKIPPKAKHGCESCNRSSE